MKTTLTASEASKLLEIPTDSLKKRYAESGTQLERTRLGGRYFTSSVLMEYERIHGKPYDLVLEDLINTFNNPIDKKKAESKRLPQYLKI